MNSLRSLPSVDQLLQTKPVTEMIYSFGRTLTLQAIRNTLDQIRQHHTDGSAIPGEDEILENTQSLLTRWTSPSLQAVINATGVILHTNLGRAPLSKAALNAIQEVSQGYSTLEYDLEKGKRGSRSLHAEDLLKHLTGVEAALVVNNNASAVLLALSALAHRRRVVIARSQLVEIGGGFRVPDVMKQSGAKLVEVGTTNRVHLSDYEQALNEQPIALIMRAHRSNFQIIGFTSEPSLHEIVTIAHDSEIPVIDDLGSGTLLETTKFGLGHEPMVQESIAAGADLVCFSGDKLLGGPQAGIIIGRSELLKKLRRHPLARAIRADKLCLAALSATLLHYLKDEEEREIPIWQMISESDEALKLRSMKWRKVIGQGEVISGQSTIGGGSLPEETLPTYLFTLNLPNPDRTLTRLRKFHPPIIGRIQDNRLILDPRTVLIDQDEILLAGLKDVLNRQE